MISSYISTISDYFVQTFQNFSLPNIGYNFNFQSKEIELLIFILLILIISFSVDRLLVNSFLGTGYRLFVSPGVILHELSHALLCVLTGAKIKSISLFDKEGGSVEHEQSKLPVIGPVLISIAPFVSGVIAIYFLANWLGMKEYDFNNAWFRYHDLISYFKNLIATIDFANYKNWIILYLALSIVVTMTPSKQDMKNITIPIIILILLAGLMYYFKFSLINMINFPTDRILALLSPILLLLILALLFSIIIFALSKLIKR